MTTDARMQAARAEQAAHWYMVLQADEVVADDLKRWQEWSRDVANQQAFDEVVRIARLAPGLKGLSVSPADSMRSPRAPFRRERWLVAAALLLVVTTGILIHWQRDPRAVYQTAVAEHRSVRLPDGSSVFLGGKTTVAVSFTSARREVVLTRGEALFTVARDARRPFTVLAGNTAITALGTIFNVNSDADRVVVKVAEGRVQLTQVQRGVEQLLRMDPPVAQTIATLAQGEEAVYAATRPQAKLSHIEPQDASAWLEGRLQYRDEKLKYVAADVNRYSGRRIVLADERSQNLVYTGTVYRDRIDEWLQGLCDLYGIRIEQADESLVRIQAP